MRRYNNSSRPIDCFFFFKIFLFILFFAIPARHSAQEPQPIEIRRVAINLELAETVAVRNKTKEADDLADRGEYYFQFGQHFQSEQNFYESSLKKNIEKAFLDRNFQVEGYGNIFRELQTHVPPNYSIGIELDHFLSNYNIVFGAVRATNFHSEITARVLILDLNTEQIVSNKEIKSKYFTNDEGFGTTKIDLTNFIEDAFNVWVADLLADTEIRSVLYSPKKSTTPLPDSELRLSLKGAPERTPIPTATAADLSFLLMVSS